MLAQMVHAASAHTSTPFKAGTSKSCLIPSRRPKLIHKEPSTGLSTLPLDLYPNICDHLSQHDLNQWARTCLKANDAAERKLWKHLNLVEGESDLPAFWRRMGRRPDFWSGYTQRCYKELIDHLEDRPDLAYSVEKLSLAAHRCYPRRVANIINLVGSTVRELDIRSTSETRVRWADPTDVPGFAMPQEIFKLIKPMPRVTKMNLALPVEWSDAWNDTLTATPYLQELRFAPLKGYAGGWDLDLDAEPEPIYEAYRTTGTAPSLPFLTCLTIEQMSTELEPAIIKLIKTSTAPTVKLVMADPAGFYFEKGKEFNKFLTEWLENGRLELEMELPKPDLEEKDLFFWESIEAQGPASERDDEIWSWLEEAYKEEPMEPVTVQGAQEDGWPSDLGLGLW